MRGVKELDSKAVDINARYLGIPTILLMENAGRKIADECLEHKKIAVFAGRGGNGGDGLAAARLMHAQGKKVAVYALAGERSRECQINYEMLSRLDFRLVDVRDSSECEKILDEVDDCDAIVDALLGVGVRGETREPARSLIKLINSLDGRKISVDIPSGDEELKVNADTVLALHSEKTPGSKTVDIGIPPEAEKYCGPGNVYMALPERTKDARKGEFGRLLVLGGSKDYVGTPTLVAQAALKTGVDLVTVCCPKTVTEKMPYDPNIIVRPLKSKKHFTEDDLEIILEQKFDAVAVGNGMGLHEDSKYALRELSGRVNVPVVVDADALRLIGRKHLTSSMILTPHEAEFEALFESYDRDERIKLVEGFARKTDTTIVLKGAVDVISDGKTTRLNKTGNPGMTVGGTGDTLAGIIGGLAAQNKINFLSACAGAFLNGLAGDIAYERLGVSMTATDVIDDIHSAIRESATFY